MKSLCIFNLIILVQKSQLNENITPCPMSLLRFVISFIYYGLTINMGKLAGNLYVNFLVGVTVEGLGYLLCFVMNKTGRKPLHLTVMFGSGFGCLLSILPALFLDSCTCKYKNSKFSSFHHS